VLVCAAVEAAYDKPATPEVFQRLVDLPKIERP